MTGTLQELNFEAILNSTTILEHSTDNLPYREEIKRNQFVLRRRIQQPTLADFNQWIKEIAEVHERSTQGRSGTSLKTASDTHQRNFNSNGTRQSSTTNPSERGTTATTTNTEQTTSATATTTTTTNTTSGAEHNCLKQ